MAKAADTTQAYEGLKVALGQLGFARPGSLARRFVRCGKPGCRCMADPPTLHGPYYDWTYKVQGKSVAMRLTEEQAQRCAIWLRNHRRLRRLVHKMETLSLKETNRILHAIAEHRGE